MNLEFKNYSDWNSKIRPYLETLDSQWRAQQWPRPISQESLKYIAYLKQLQTLVYKYVACRHSNKNSEALVVEINQLLQTEIHELITYFKLIY